MTDLPKRRYEIKDVDRGYKATNTPVPMDNLKEVIAALVMARHRLGLSETVVAKKLGCSNSTVWALEKLRTLPTWEFMAKYAEAVEMRLILSLVVPADEEESNE